MKTIRRVKVFHILLLTLAFVGVASGPSVLGQTNGTNLTNYIVLKLKDHTALEGPVLKEDDDQLVIISQFGSGTITRKDTIKKTDIASFSYLTEDERLRHLAPWAYRALDKYQLDSQYSYPLSYYDNVINEYFKPFLVKYPGTPEADKVIARLADWRVEHDKVANNQAKFRGEWMTTGEAQARSEKERTQQILQRAKTFISVGQYQSATDVLSPYYSVTQPPELAQETRRLQAEIYHLWISSLDARQQELIKDADVTKDRVARAVEGQTRAQAAFTQARSALINSDRRSLGDDATVSQAGNDMLRAQKELADSQTHQASTKEELDYTIRALADVRHAADVFASAFPVIESVKEIAKETPSSPTSMPPQILIVTNTVAKSPAPPPTPAPAPTPSVLQDMAEWFAKNWIIVAGGGLLALWGISRLFTRT